MKNSVLNILFPQKSVKAFMYSVLKQIMTDNCRYENPTIIVIVGSGAKLFVYLLKMVIRQGFVILDNEEIYNISNLNNKDTYFVIPSKCNVEELLERMFEADNNSDADFYVINLPNKLTYNKELVNHEKNIYFLDPNWLLDFDEQQIDLRGALDKAVPLSLLDKDIVNRITNDITVLKFEN